jgi:hypothetical protein
VVTLDVAKIRRRGYVFVARKSDHSPRHVHVYRNGRLVVKWDLESGLAMKGNVSRRLLDAIKELEAEGRL